MNNKHSVSIYGAGISGLTSALELVEKGFDVTVYELDSTAGGMAKSKMKGKVPTEHSWRGYGPFYYNAFDILKRIPIDSNCKLEKFNHGSVYSISQIEEMAKTGDLICYSRNGDVYDFTKFINHHPGGSIIKIVAGKEIETVWEENGYSWHKNNSHVEKHLEEYKIGTLSVLENFENNKFTAFDNLSDHVLNFKLLFNDNKENPKLNVFDYLFLFYYSLKVLGSDKRQNEYFKTRFEPIAKKFMSKEGYHYILDFLSGPGYGLDKNTMSSAHFLRFIEYNLLSKETGWKVMVKPTSKAWIDPLVNYLKHLGVKFNFNTRLEKIIIDENNPKKILNTEIGFKQIICSSL